MYKVCMQNYTGPDFEFIILNYLTTGKDWHTVTNKT